MAGTLGALLTAYRASLSFTDLAPMTRRGYLQMIEILTPLDGLALVDLTPPYVASIRDKLAVKRGRRTANFVLAVLSVACKHGVEKGLLPLNPVRGIARMKPKKNQEAANRPWTAAERQAVMARLPPHLARVIALGMHTGLRVTDCLTLPGSAIVDGWLERKTSKTGQVVRIPVHPALQRLLDGAPPASRGTRTLVYNSFGEPWTACGFRASWRKERLLLEREGLVGVGLTFHGLRHTVGALLRGCTDDLDLIRRWLGQATLTMAIHYSKSADTDEAMSTAMRRFDPLGGLDAF